jgi:hypothetical protein
MYYYYTELDVEECKKRINEIVETDWALDECKIRGKVNDKSDRFYLKNDIKCRSSFLRIFYGELINEENGTIIRGDFHISITTKIFMTIWFAVITLPWVNILISYISNLFLGTSYSYSCGFVEGLIGPPIMLMFGILFVSAGIKFSEKSEEYIFKLIKTTLKAKEIDH